MQLPRLKSLKKISLIGQRIGLYPLKKSDAPALVKAAEDGNLSKSVVTIIPNSHNIASYIKQALDMQDNFGALVLIIKDLNCDKIIGCSRYFNVSSADCRLEIGHTWLAKSYQRTFANTETKLLMLTHAFEDLAANVVEFRTDFLNHQSRNAILRLGAKQDGILRNNTVMPNGRIRDTVVFSIIASEWPGIKVYLQAKLKKFG